MKHYAYYPGCSLHATAADYDVSARAVMNHLDISYSELDDWNCCGATALASDSYLFSLLAPARNLALAGGDKGDMVVACNACYVAEKRALKAFKEGGEWSKRITEGLLRIDKEIDDDVEVLHLLQVLVNEVGLEEIENKAVRNLEGLKLAPYYGCQYSRPETEGIHPESPMDLERLLEVTGAEVLDFNRKTRCCGSSLMSTKEEHALRLCGEILKEADYMHADAIVVTCPLCQLNLDAFQPRVNGLLGSDYRIPILFFTQVVGLALGLDPKALGIGKQLTSCSGFLEKYRKGA